MFDLANAFWVLAVHESAHVGLALQNPTTAAPDPVWFRLIVAGLPSFLALGIAWAAFRWNRGNEHRRWVLDHKTIEWKKLLELASEVERFMPSVEIGKVITDAVCDSAFREHLHEFTRESLNCVFIASEQASQIYEKLLKIQVLNDTSKGEMELFRADPHSAAARERPTPLESARKVQLELASLWRDVRSYAAEDLEVRRRIGWTKHFKRRNPVRHEPLVN